MNEADEIKHESKLWIDANVHDGEDRSGCHTDVVRLSPDDLQDLVDDLIDHLLSST